MQSTEFKLNFFLQKGIIKDELGAIQSITQIIQITTYIILTKILIDKHTQRMKNSVSMIDKVSLHWLSVSFNYFISIFGLIVAHLILIYFGVDLTSIYYITIPVFLTIFVYVLGYHGLKQPEIIIQPEEESSDKKYERSTLTEEKSEEYLIRLIDIMKNQKPYLESDLTLLKLAEQLGISTHHLSQVINEKLSQNFYDFVNNYRVEEAKRLLLEPTKNAYTIFAIAAESGFNSKSAFNSCFKKFTNLTPSEFKKLNSSI
jgi:AraC-like DNA-binding protein